MPVPRQPPAAALTAAPDGNVLPRALAGLLQARGPLPGALFDVAAQLVRDRTADPAAFGELTRALAAHPHTPEPLLTALLDLCDESNGLAATLAGNAEAPAGIRVRAVGKIEGTFALGKLADDGTDPVALTALARRAGTARRAKVKQRWRLNSADQRVPVDACLWEGVAASLLHNKHLPVPAGRQLVTAVLPHLHADLAEAGDDDDSAAAGNRSLLLPGVRRWLRRDPGFAADLARAEDHPWILVAAATLPDAPADVVDRAFWTLLAPALSADGGDRPVPSLLSELAVVLAGRVDDGRRELLGQWLRGGWRLTNSYLKPIAHPPAPVTPDADVQLFATGAVADVLARFAALTAADKRPPERAVYAFVARRDVPTDAARTVAAAVNDTGRVLLRARRFDFDFCADQLAAKPGWFDDVLDEDGDVDLVLAAMTRFHARRREHGGGTVSLRELVRHDRLLPKLGADVLRLPWPVLAELTGLHPDVDVAVTTALTTAAGHAGAAVLLPQLAAVCGGPLTTLTDAAGGALG